METAVRWGMLSAWSIAIITPVVLMALLVNRQLRKGFTGMVGD
jgi:ABC-type glycerol-3-phosphate transport system permease component